ncbi:hypothetical protein [Mesotoga sp. BH458_6_3_2_1]|uniref:hypothetical protein n=1 Tax=Mesotoga sp. BH458_6_3_2_1 TaxID=1437446 RepID=UPI000FF87422|nr:hypothetical protein [Mesotoga sp. BH458_6_3_2_1]RLL85939.1 hypothetical protein Y697_14010 [Mesotoga sp. BH458_6_3_2_1]
MKLIPARRSELKNLKLALLVLTLGMLVASVYASYCVLTKGEVLQANPQYWIVVIGVYVFTFLSAIYYIVLETIYRRRRHTDW